jgi:uncharacterized integral membrane protein
LAAARLRDKGAERAPLLAPLPGAAMRWTHTAVIIVFVAIVAIFALQNLQSITVSFLNLRMSAPLALVAVLIYLLGMITGGSVWSLIRWAVQGTRPEQLS